MIIKALIAILVLFIVPELLGLLILRFWKEQKNNIILAFVLGYIIQFAIGQLISVPLIFKGGTLTDLVRVYVAVISVLSIISFVINVFRVKEIIIDIFANIKNMPILLSLMLIILIVMQLAVYVKYGHIDDDDATYVATATVAVQTDTLYKYSATTGTDSPWEQSIMRYRLGPFPLFYAIVSKVIDIHPAIVAHFILPLIFLPIVYMIYWLFAKELFEDNKKSSVLFMIFICVLHFFSHYNGKNNFIFALIRIWQGKAVLANIIIPLIILLYLYTEKYNLRYISFISIFLSILAGNFATTMAIAMAPVTLILLVVIYQFVKLISKETQIKKSLVVILKSLICCLPSIAYGLIYLINYIKQYLIV